MLLVVIFLDGSILGSVELLDWFEEELLELSEDVLFVVVVLLFTVDFLSELLFFAKIRKPPIANRIIMTRIIIEMTILRVFFGFCIFIA